MVRESMTALLCILLLGMTHHISGMEATADAGLQDAYQQWPGLRLLLSPVAQDERLAMVKELRSGLAFAQVVVSTLTEEKARAFPRKMRPHIARLAEIVAKDFDGETASKTREALMRTFEDPQRNLRIAQEVLGRADGLACHESPVRIVSALGFMVIPPEWLIWIRNERHRLELVSLVASCSHWFECFGEGVAAWQRGVPSTRRKVGGEFLSTLVGCTNEGGDEPAAKRQRTDSDGCR